MRATAVYEIRIEGHLDSRRAARFADMTIARKSKGETALTGPVADMAALYGLLSRIRDRGVAMKGQRRSTFPARRPVGIRK
jgi:hypothetical protein